MLKDIQFCSELKQNGCLTLEVKTFTDMIFHGEMGKTVNHKMTVIGRCFCVQISQISEFDQSFCGFSITSKLLTPCHLAFTVLG